VNFKIRKATELDFSQLKNLYFAVASVPGGLARESHEISDPFIHSLIREASHCGLILVAETALEAGEKIVAAIHATHSEANNLNHVMGHLTVLVDPDFQGKGLGKSIFSSFLKTIESEMRFIMRVELRARASNEFALKLYESLGFRREGRFIDRIKKMDGEYEDGIAMAWFNPGFQKSESFAREDDLSARRI
jgi:RimJ/RimL family protein N-acetyltransferase